MTTDRNFTCSFEVRHPCCVSNKLNFKVYSYIVKHNSVLGGMLSTCRFQTVLMRNHKANFLLQIPIFILLITSHLVTVKQLNLGQGFFCHIRARVVSDRHIIEQETVNKFQI